MAGGRVKSISERRRPANRGVWGAQPKEKTAGGWAGPTNAEKRLQARSALPPSMRVNKCGRG